MRDACESEHYPLFQETLCIPYPQVRDAAATMLVLHTLAAGREVIISRGQLVEIGGSFRMPDVMAMSSAVMREVGTTNRTHLRDYENAIGERTGALLHVHTSNYRVRGFASTPGIRELAELGRSRGLPVIDDIGSGALVALDDFGMTNEPLVADSLSAGADVACFSGDKLIGGPQSGILVGRREIVDRLRKSPFARMFRVCKLTLAALEATLVHFVNGDYAEALPFYRMLGRPLGELGEQAESFLGRISGLPGVEAEADDDVAYIGSGSIPDEGIPSRVVRLRASPPPDELVRRLRVASPPIFARIQDDAVVFDMRTLSREEADEVSAALRGILGRS